MRKLNILFLDFGLSKDKTESALSYELNSSVFNLGKSLREQLRKDDDLGKEMMKLLDSGKMLTTDIIGKFISKNLKEIDDNVLLAEYPRTVEQFNGLKKVLITENIEIENIWYFKQNEPKTFMKEHFENPKQRQWVDKYGSEIIDNWKTKFKERSEQITEIKKASDEYNWKVIEMDFVADLSTEYIQQRIKDCA
ncbi:nucleoside monophosphate kinase [Dokdonia sp. 4H-3-7-5]|uniref:nucleoside monophosphate kinase n=1 Tax=Dokdonia sp. (strain 4H-3-7-5) TaxID=983548 RepID=UPI00020A6F87|nr:nucleoside monophosphate kinase [Dokdonia sp. 4H-3-7-5]AEE20233.1 hypothetical protein Krodi_2253 [Dokdonia sp. 4H-3-7-5]